jgi:D-lyxose ketol-isomerase
MHVREGQRTPMHYHPQKMEDIINRGGGNLIIESFHPVTAAVASRQRATDACRRASPRPPNVPVRRRPWHKPYAEKVMHVREGQRTPMHYHPQKMEDIINRSVAVAVMYFDNQIAAAAIDNVFHFLRMIVHRRPLALTHVLINRGGGNLIIEIHNRDGDGLAHSAVAVTLDGMRQSHVAGSQLRLSPGESVTLEAGIWHSFWPPNVPVRRRRGYVFR